MHSALGGTQGFNHCEFVECASCRQVTLGDLMKLQWRECASKCASIAAYSYEAVCLGASNCTSIANVQAYCQEAGAWWLHSS